MLWPAGETSQKISFESPSARVDSTTWTDKSANPWLFGEESFYQTNLSEAYFL
jgi:hypothetical protein